MKRTIMVSLASKGFIYLSAFSLLSVSLMAFFTPQSVMDLVNVKLGNTDAYSSIRGVYGGVGLTIFCALVYLAFNDSAKGLAFLSLLWGLYALSRIITIFAEGSLGDFGNKWLMIESFFFLISITLLILGKNRSTARTK